MVIKEKFYSKLQQIREDAEQLDEITSQKASKYLKANVKQVRGRISLLKALKRADGRDLAIAKLSGTAKVPTKDT